MDDDVVIGAGEEQRYPEEMPRVFLRRWCVEQAINVAFRGEGELIGAAQKIFDWVTEK